MIRFHSINGELVAAHKAKIAINDLGLLRGYGIFDFFPIRNGQPLFAVDYFDRFYRSADRMRIPVPIARTDLMQQVIDLAARNGLARAYTKLVLTGGYAADGFTPKDSNLLIIQHDDIPYRPEDYQNGIRLLLNRYGRDKPKIKTLNYANVLRQRQVLQDTGALDILYHDGRHVFESSRANFFLFDSEGRLHTSGANTLEGVTRKHVIQTARAAGIVLAQGPMRLDMISSAREAFITSTTKGVLPVTMVNDLTISEGKVGSMTLELHHMFEDYMKEAAK